MGGDVEEGEVEDTAVAEVGIDGFLLVGGEGDEGEGIFTGRHLLFARC